MTADGWNAAPGGGWYRQGMLGEDGYYVKIAPWPTGAGVVPSVFPFIYSTGYVKQVSAFAFNRGTGPLIAAATIFEELVAQGKMSKRVVEATTTNVPTFTKGLVTKGLIDLNGKNIFTDSYNSTNSAQSTGGRWDPSKALDHGDIASNDILINVGNATIKGNVATGPRGTANVGNGVVGDAAFVANMPANAGKIQAGHFRDDMNVEFIDPQVPSGSSVWLGLPSPNNTVIDGVTYQYVLPNGGQYLISGTDTLSSKGIYIAGNVQIRVDTRINMTGQDVIFVGPNGNLTLYANCADVNVGGNGIINPGFSTAMTLLGTTKCLNIALGGNGEFTGTIDAPNAHMDFNGGGSSSGDFSGAAKVKDAKFNGHYKFHFDEALPKIGRWRGFVLTSWNER
jgi:hypothetical protein